MVNNDYDELERIVNSYKIFGNDSDTLITMFDPFIKVYINLLKRGMVCLFNKRILNFLSLFMPTYSKDIYRLNKPGVKKRIDDKVYELNKLLELYNNDEVYNEATITILSMAKKYNSYGGPRFHMYVNKCFNFFFKKRIETMIMDPLLHGQIEEFNEDNFLIDDDPMEEHIISMVDQFDKLKKCIIKSNKQEDYGFNWINGLIAGDEFKMLDALDRKILILYYINNLTDEKIANVIGYEARETITRRRLRAKNKVFEYGKVYHMF